MGWAMSVNIEVTLTLHLCSCGTCYALPHWITVGYQCPMCGRQKYERLQERFDEVYQEKSRLERVVRGLRGALKQKAVQK